MGSAMSEIDRKPIILIAPTAFKGSLSAMDAAETIRAFLIERCGQTPVELRFCPIADGGDDTIALLEAANPAYQRYTVSVTGPLPGMAVEAQYLYHAKQKTAFLEAAQAHGLKLMPADQPLAPLEATSYGVGELIREVMVKHQPETLVVTVGGSTSTDGGLGALQALGIRFLDASGQALSMPLSGGVLRQISRVEWPTDWPMANWKQLMIATDVVNPLLGDAGAARVFGPQKGATPEQCQALDEGLQHISRLLSLTGDEGDCGEVLTTLPGVGAAGGLAYGLRCLPRTGLVSGSQWVSNQLDLLRQIAESDIILTGEGCLDATSLGGKATGYVLALAGDKPVLFFCGQVRDGLGGWGQVTVFPMVGDDQPNELQFQAVQEVMRNPKAALRKLLERAWPKLEVLISIG